MTALASWPIGNGRHGAEDRLAIRIGHHNAPGPAGSWELVAHLASRAAQVQLLTVVQATRRGCHDYLRSQQIDRPHVRSLCHAVNDRLDGRTIIGQHSLFQATFGNGAGSGGQQLEVSYRRLTL